MRILITALTMLLLIHGKAQDCMKQVREVYAAMESRFDENRDKAFALHYSLTVAVPGKKGEEKHETDVRLYADEEKSYFISDKIKVYQDESASVSIIPANKSIHIKDYTGDAVKEAKTKQFAFMHDTLFTFATVKTCEAVMLNGEPLTKVQLELNQQGVQLFQTTLLEFYLLKDGSGFRKIDIKYRQGFRFSRMEVLFKNIAFGNASAELAVPVFAHVFNENGSLLPKYRDFQIIDNRIKQ